MKKIALSAFLLSVFALSASAQNQAPVQEDRGDGVSSSSVAQFSDLFENQGGRHGESRVEANGYTPPVGLYPNPTKNSITLTCDLCGIFEEEEIRVKVVDVQGKLQAEMDGTLQNINSNMGPYITPLPAGLYWVQIQSKDRVQFVKFLKQ